MRTVFYTILTTFAMMTNLNASLAQYRNDKPSDEEIAKVVLQVNHAEVSEAKMALSKSNSNDVKKFAKDMMRDHSKAADKIAALMKKIKISAIVSPSSSTMKEHSKMALAKLKEQSGSAFDKAYVDDAVDGHQKFLSELDSTLIPSAKNIDLSSMLAEIRSTVAMHLDHARSLQILINQ